MSLASAREHRTAVVSTRAREEIHVAVRVDASANIGVGHAVRCLALVQELSRRSVRVTVFGMLDIGWVADAYERLGVPVMSPSQIDRAHVTHAVIDGYDISPELGAGLRSNAVRVLAMVDDEFGAGQVADVYVDQNYGARPHVGGPDGSIALAGPPYSLLRDEVLAVRSAPVLEHTRVTSDAAPRVLAVFGGTDPHGAAEVLVPMLVETGAPMQLTVVCPDPARGARLSSVPVQGPHQHVTVTAVLPNLAATAAAHDVAVSAAGSTVWELLTIGTPTAVVCVVDNQEAGYRATTGSGLVVPAGRLTQLQTGDRNEREAGVESLARLLTDGQLQHHLRRRGMAQFDGRGRERVADALLDSAQFVDGHGRRTPDDGGVPGEIG